MLGMAFLGPTQMSFVVLTHNTGLTMLLAAGCPKTYQILQSGHAKSNLASIS